MDDSITTEIIRYGLLSATEEMARSLCRTAFNTIIYELHDYGVAIHDRNGDVVASPPGIAIFTRGNDHGLKRSIEFLGEEALTPGDIFLLNYPYWSAAHTLDVLVFAPIHHETRLIGYVSCRVHVLDLKQKDPGYVIDSTDMYQEGMFFPATKIYSAGVENSDFFNIVRFNSRMPERTIGDIQAQVSACMTGVQRTSEIAGKYGVDRLLQAMDSINDHGERLARLGLAKLPNGTWTAHDFIDNDGVDLDRAIKMNVTVTVSDTEMVVDWTGSDRDVRGPVNVARGATEAVCSLIFKSLTSPSTPVVAGNFRPLRVITEPGSVMHAVPPMPTFTMGAALLAGEVILKALAEGMPEIVPACSGGDVCSMMGLGFNSRTGKEWLEAINEAVGFGGHSGGDGADGIMHLAEPGCRNNPVEVLEAKSTMLIEHYGYRTDTGGPGRFRGGVGVGRTYRFLEPATAISLMYKSASRPWAIGAGGTGENNHIVINPGTPKQVIKRASYNRLEPGEVLINNTGGGGGYEDPFLRDPSLVAADVRNGFVSIVAAARDYGVVVDAATFDIDESSTSSLRAAERRV